MTEQEQKELELFKEWWNSIGMLYRDIAEDTLQHAAEEAWLARAKLDKTEELKDFCIWLIGCGYDFTQHEYFNTQRDKLLK